MSAPRNVRSLAAAAAMLGLAGSAFGQELPPAQPLPQPAATPAPAAPAAPSYLQDLNNVVAGMAQQYGAKILVDPTLVVKAKPTAPSPQLALPQALSALASTLPGSAWRRVYIQASQAASIRPEKLAATVRALDEVEQSGIVVENPTAGRATSYLKNFKVEGDLAGGLVQQSFDPKPIYIVYNTKAVDFAANVPGATSADKMVNLQRQMFNMMMKMSPDEASNAMSQSVAQSMQMFMGLDPQVRARFLSNQMKAGMQMWSNMPDSMKQEIFSNIREALPGMLGGVKPPQQQ